jgi:cephalosporin-C deacetylase-like acetyl esterase
LRALEFGRTLPGWNGKDLYLAGGSQGAFQAVAVAALSDGISGCFIRVPWFCDLYASKVGRIGSTFRPNPAPGLGYFDTVNFAKRVKAPVAIEAGLSDWVCPPSGVRVLYNNLKYSAKMTMYQGLDHGGYPAYDERTTPRTISCK